MKEITKGLITVGLFWGVITFIVTLTTLSVFEALFTSLLILGISFLIFALGASL